MNFIQNVKINGKTYTISIIDTKDTIKNMISLKEKVFKSYILFTTFKLNDGDIKIELLPDKVKKVSIKNLKQDVLELSKIWNIEPIDITLEWLKIHKKGVISSFDIDLLDILKDIDSTQLWSINSIVNMYKLYVEKFDAEQKALQETIQKETDFRNEYKKYNPLETTAFIQDSIITEYNFTIDVDPLEAFDNIVLTNEIPFVRLKTEGQIYYKVLDNIIPLESWLEGNETFIFKIKTTNIKDDWETATIVYKTDLEPYDAILNIETNIIKGKSNDEILVKNIINLFNDTKINIKNRIEKGMKGVFAVPRISITRDVFLDLITNDPMVSYYFYIDETRELSSQKGVLYLYYSPLNKNIGDDENVLTVFLSQKIVSRSDPFYINKELLLFTPYLNVRVSRAKTLEQIERFQTAFSLILDIYIKKYNQILKDYNQFIPDFKKNNVLKTDTDDLSGKRLKELQTQDAELFIYGYPSKCEKKKQPIPINKKAHKEWTSKDRQIMNYPKGSMNFFVCPDEEFKYPGLIKNNLFNNDTYEYLPCCYPINQKTGNKNWSNYLKEIDIDKKQRAKTTNIVSKKALTQEGKLGYLPKNIYYILSQSKEPKTEFLRYGVPESNNSFIEAVLIALDPNYISVENKTEYVTNFRNNLAYTNKASVIQQLYNITETELQQNILNPDVIFDSKLYIGILELYFNCQIVVFSRSDQQPNGEFELPRYTQGYLYNKLKPDTVTVLIYKHLGARSNNLTNPHYELIIKRTDEKLITWYFKDNNLIKNIYSNFLRSYKLYIIGQSRYNAIDVPPNKLTNSKGQVVDIYGKTRGFVFENNIYISTNPITPVLDLPIVKKPDVLPSLQTVLAFLKKKNIKILYQDVDENNDKLVGLMLDIPELFYCYVSVQNTSNKLKVPIQKNIGYSIDSSTDILEQTIFNRKIADFLMQNVLYKFSIWYNNLLKKDKKLKEKISTLETLSVPNKLIEEKILLNEYITKFVSNEIIIIPNHNYSLKTMSRRLSLNSNFYKDDKLVVDSQETKTRLNYYLRFMLNKNTKLVLNFKDNVYLDNYYTYSIDFKQTQGQLIFIGGLSITNWTQTRLLGVSAQIHQIPHPTHTEPFFFSHWAINNGKPLIIQNVLNGSLNSALSVSKYYLDNGVNKGYNYELKEVPDTFTEYFFKDGILMKNGIGKIKVWKYTTDYYAAILEP
jgi:hypothetical protein